MGVEDRIRALRHAESFVDVGRVVISLREAFPIVSSVVEIWAREGPPVVSVDDVPSPALPVAVRLRYLESLHAIDPMRAGMLAAHAVVGTEVASSGRVTDLAREHGWRGATVHPLYVPLLDEIGVIGAIRIGFGQDIPRTLRADLARLGTHVSIRLAKLGIGPAEDVSQVGSLTRRQRQVATLAMSSRTNREISDALELSIDTVKKHLKDVFARLAITSRRELRAVLGRLTPVSEIPQGLSHQDGLTLARLDLHARP